MIRSQSAFWSAAICITATIGCGSAMATESGASLYVPGLHGPGAGIVPPPGFYFENDFYSYSGRLSASTRTQIGGAVLANVKVEARVNFATPTWVTPLQIFGGNLGWFSGSLTAGQRALQYADPIDASATLAARARSYLHSNCSHCHRPDAAPVAIDLRHAISFAATGTCNALPQSGSLGITDARVLAPGEPARSLLHNRMNRRDAYAMPPLASTVIDSAGAGLIADNVAIVLPIAAIVLALRERKNDGTLSFAQAVATALVVGLVSLPITAGFLWWYHHSMNPGWVDYIVEYKRASMTAAGATPDAIAQMETTQRASAADGAQFVGALVGTTVITLVIGAIAGAIMRTRTPKAS